MAVQMLAPLGAEAATPSGIPGGTFRMGSDQHYLEAVSYTHLTLPTN